MMRTRFCVTTLAVLSAALPLLAAGAAALSGCGSSSGSEPGGPVAGAGYLTRATEGDVSQDARVLAERAADAPRIPLDLARGIDADLAKVRAQFPAVAGLSARPQSDLHQVIVKLAAEAPFASEWDASRAATGDAALDAELSAYGSVTVRPFSGLPGYYRLRFDEPLSIPRVAERLKAASASVAAVTPDLTVGDGDDITRDAAAGTYTFSKGWGDCSAGCINRHTWTFRVSGDSVTLVEEGGTPL